MTVAANNYLPAITQGDGATTGFNFPWPILEAADLVVSLFDSVALTLTILVQGVDYTLNINSLNTPNGGGIVLTVAPTATQYLVRSRALPATQQLSLQTASGFDPHDLEQEFDRLVLLVQQLLFLNSASLQLPANVLPANFSPTLPQGITAPIRQILATKPDGTGLALLSPAGAAGLNQRVFNQQNGQITTADDVVLADCTNFAGGLTLVLPPVAQAKGKLIYVKKNNASGHNLNISTGDGSTIDGAPNVGSGAAYYQLPLYCDGTQWLIL